MTTAIRELSDSPIKQISSNQREILLALAVNFGLASFILGVAWEFYGAPSRTEFQSSLKLMMIGGGIDERLLSDS
jgi:hypothetical protein